VVEEVSFLSVDNSLNQCYVHNYIAVRHVGYAVFFIAEMITHTINYTENMTVHNFELNSNIHYLCSFCKEMSSAGCIKAHHK
jgi:hypothetical protein